MPNPRLIIFRLRTASITLLLVGLAGSSISAFAQHAKPTPPNLSGVWVWVKDVPPRGLRDEKHISGEKTVIQTADKIEIIDEDVYANDTTRIDRIYYLDGRGEANDSIVDPKLEIVSRTTFKKDEIHIESTYRKKSTKKSVENSPQILIYSMSKDGQSLTVELRLDLAAMMMGQQSTLGHPTQFSRSIYKRKS